MSFQCPITYDDDNDDDDDDDDGKNKLTDFVFGLGDRTHAFI